MVAKDIFSFATVIDQCKEANFIGFSNEYEILDTTFRVGRAAPRDFPRAKPEENPHPHLFKIGHFVYIYNFFKY